MKEYIQKFRTETQSPKHPGIHFSTFSGIGGFIAITLVSLLTQYTDSLFLMAPFGATCVLAFGLPTSPLAQPRNIIGGHLIATAIGILCYHFLGNEWYSLALGVGLSITVMQLTSTLHAPAGADPIVVILGAKGISFLFNPVLSGAIVITLVALVFNNLSSIRKYPTYWR